MMFGSSCDVHAMTRSASRDARVLKGRTACAVALDGHDVEAIRESSQPRGVDVEHRHGVLVVKRLDDRRAHLAGTDDEDPHRAGGRLAFAPRRCVECPGGRTPAPGTSPRARTRHAGALRDRLRQRRLLDLLRAGRHGRYALGLTPLVFVIAGFIFAATALTYAEGTVRYPEAGGSSSFARHAFNELV